MLLLFALGATAQPALYGGNGPYYGPGTPGPYYGAGASYGMAGSNGGARQVAQNNWDLYQADQTIRAADLNARGNNLFYNTNLNTLFPSIDPIFGANTGLLRYGSYEKTLGNQVNEDRIQDDIDRYRALHPQLTQADRDHLDDLILQRESARNQKLRRTVQTIPTVFGGSAGRLPAFFERRANQDDLDLAQNAYYDARRDVASDPSRDKIVQLRNARDGIEQADDRRDANTLDLLGTSFGGAGRYGSVLRKQASQTKLEIGYRNLRLAQQQYAEKPTEINRMQVQLANLFIDATSQEDDGNKNDIIAANVLGKSPQFSIYNAILDSKNFQDEANLWLRYNRLKRKILIRQQLEDAQGKASSQDSGSVENRMLGMSTYGPPGPSRAAAGNPFTGGGNPR